jgi:Zn-dependent protease
LVHFVYPYLRDGFFPQHVLQFLIVFACTNVGIAIFNLIPLYPLDGYQIVYALLPNRQAAQFARSATYGPFIILAIFFFLPFLAQIARLPSNPIFEPAFFIWQGAASLVGLVIPGGFPVVSFFYML